MGMKIILCDTSEVICTKWMKYLGMKNVVNTSGLLHEFQVYHGTLERLLADEISHINSCAIISPGNSFGYLGGGFDLAIRNHLGGENFERWFRNQIGGGYHHIGSSTIVDLELDNGSGGDSHPWRNKGIRYVVHIPTIVAPSKPLYNPKFPMRTGYEPVFNAAWNSLVSCVPLKVDTLIMPGLCSGWFGVPPEITCKSMGFALRLFALRNQISVDLQNALIMYFLQYPFKPFLNSGCKEECRRCKIDLTELENFDVRKNSLESIIPDI